jgi:DNA (cytosine-5)-methyltransferase 1
MSELREDIQAPFKFIDLFCGLGAFRIGFEEAGFKCVFSSDINEKIQNVYEENFGDRPHGDITQINPNEIPDFDILLGGFPCQPFSISGKKQGFNDTRGTLFFSICKIIEEKQPQIVILENVKHLINHDKKRTINVILGSLKELGYNVNYELLNAKDFGLPQNRERIFIIATKNGVFDFSKLKKTKSPPLIEFLEKSGKFEYLKKNEYTLLEEGVYKEQEQSGLIFIGYRNKNGFKNGVRPNSEHLNRSHRQPNRIYSVLGYHPTIPSQESSGRFFIYFPKEDLVRKLSLEECYKIMGYPVNYKRIGLPSEQYKQIGNSVAINVVRAVAIEVANQKLIRYDAEREVNRNIHKIINNQYSLAV